MKAGTIVKPAGAIAFLGSATSMDHEACIAAQKEAVACLKKGERYEKELEVRTSQ